MSEPMPDAPDDDFGFIKGEPWLDEKPPITAEGLWPAMLRYYGASESIEVTYATDRPLPPDSPEPTEEQKLAAAEAANAQIEQWRERWESGVLNYDLPPVPRPPYPPLSDRVARGDGPRSRDYPAGG